MVGYWLPEPPRGVDEVLHVAGGGPLILESEESDDDVEFVYELLPTDMLQGNELPHQNDSINPNNDEGSDSDNETFEMAQDEESDWAAVGAQPLSADMASSERRPDIEVNCDEVRAAMSNITLPPSAIPNWASSIPESQWKSFLIARIKGLQTEPTSK